MKKATGMQQLAGLAYFAVGVAALVGVLMVANWAPLFINEGTMRSYASIEDVHRKLNIKDIPMPSYIPQSLIWPPSAILAQTTPYEAVLIEFEGVGGGTALLIFRSASKNFDPGGKVRLEVVGETVAHDLRGRAATIETGTCSDGLTCSRIWWDEGGYRTHVLMRAPPMELLRIAESLIN